MIWIRQGTGVARRASGQGNASVEPQQARRPVVVDRGHGHVTHQVSQVRGQTIERLSHHRLKVLGINLDHDAIIRQVVGRVPGRRAELLFTDAVTRYVWEAQSPVRMLRK